MDWHELQVFGKKILRGSCFTHSNQWSGHLVSSVVDLPVIINNSSMLKNISYVRAYHSHDDCT